MNHLLGGGVLGDSLGALGHGVLGQLTGEEQTDGGLDLPRGNGGPLVVVSQTAGLGGDALEDVVHERVHDRHGLGGDASVGVSGPKNFTLPNCKVLGRPCDVLAKEVCDEMTWRLITRSIYALSLIYTVKLLPLQCMLVQTYK